MNELQKQVKILQEKESLLEMTSSQQQISFGLDFEPLSLQQKPSTGGTHPTQKGP